MKAQIYLLLKLTLLPVVLLGAFYILEYGFKFDSTDKFIRPLLLSGFTTGMVLNLKLRRFVLIASSILLVIMAFAYIFQWQDLSNAAGNFGFSLLIITVFLYFPQIIKKGCVEKF